MYWKPLLITAAASTLSLTGTSLSAQVYPLSENSWDNPGFRERFMGSYGVNTEVSPDITPKEKALFEEIVPLVSSSPLQAIERLENAVGADNSAAFDFILGNLLYQENRMEAAVAAYQEAIRKFPNYHRAYLNAGRAYVAMAHYEDGLTYLSKALELQPGDGSLYGLIGYCHLNLESYATALDAYRMAIMLDPKSRDWKLGKLKSHEALGQTDEAIGMLYEFIAANPDDAQWWKFQANQFIRKGDVAKAAANLTVVQELGAADGASLVLLGDIYLNEGLLDPAAQTYLAALEEPGVRPVRILQVVESFIQLGELERARNLLTAAEGTVLADLEEPQQLDVLNLKAKIALDEGDPQSATAYLEEIVNRDPMNGNALLTLADFHSSHGDLPRAELYAENASKLDPFAHRAYLILAQIKVKQTDYRAAARFLRNAQQIEPKDYVADYLAKVEQAAMRM